MSLFTTQDITCFLFLLCYSIIINCYSAYCLFSCYEYIIYPFLWKCSYGNIPVFSRFSIAIYGVSGIYSFVATPFLTSQEILTMTLSLSELKLSSFFSFINDIFILDVANLKDIIEALKKGLFPNHRWSPLGLQLGLLQPTLSTIKANHKDDVESCLLECLTLWLRKADKVTESGGPTWDSLASALNKLGENATADKIKEFSEELEFVLHNIHLIFTTEESFTPACQMLLQHTDRLSPLILPVEIVQMLYEERVISKETLHEMNRLGSVLGEGPLRALCTAVSKNPNILKVFASVLLKSEETIQIAKDILKEYGK